MFKKALMTALAAVLWTALLPTSLTIPVQPPVNTSTLYVGHGGWGPKYADPVGAYDSRSCELILNVYDTLIEMGGDVGNPLYPNIVWHSEEQYWEFRPRLAVNVPDPIEMVMVIPDNGINYADPKCYWWYGGMGIWYHIEGWVDNNPDGEFGVCDVLYIGEYTAPELPVRDAITVRTWHVKEVVPGDYVTVHHVFYDFQLRTDPVIYFKDYQGNHVGQFGIDDVVYSFRRGLVQDQYSSPMWMFYKPFFDQMNSDFWDTGDPDDAWELSHLINDTIEVVSTNPPVVRFNLGITFPDVAFKQIMSQTWASILDKDWCISKGCWDDELFSDDGRYPGSTAGNNIPDWFEALRHKRSPIQSVKPENYAGTGPYRVVVASEPDNLVVLERNPQYWRGWPAPFYTNTTTGELTRLKSFLERIDIKYICDWEVRREAFKACELDICDVPRANMMELLDPNDPSRMRVGWGDPFVEHPEIVTIKNFWPSLMLDSIFYCFTVNKTSTALFTRKFPNGIPYDFFNNVYVRRAFSYAFNHTWYLNNVYFSEAICRETPDIQFLVPDYYCHSPDPPWTYDKNLTAIIECLQKAMFTQDGVTKSVWDWGGFHLIIYYNTCNEDRRLACEIIKHDFNEINAQYGKNFTIDIQGLDWPTFLNAIEDFMLPMYVTGWQADFAKADNLKRSFMHSYGYFAYFQNYTSWNGWCNTIGSRTGLTKDILIDLAVKTPDGPDRQAMYKDLDDIYLEDCPSMPIAQPIGRKWLKYWVKGWYYNALYGASASAFLGTCDYYYYLYKEDTCWYNISGPTLGVPDDMTNIRDATYLILHFNAKAPEPEKPVDPRWVGTYGVGGVDPYGDRVCNMRDPTFLILYHFNHGNQP